MKSKILSLNIGHPAPMEWNGKSIVSSMLKHPVPGPLVVHRDHIQGNSFAHPEFHGTLDFLLYIYGLPSIASFLRTLKMDPSGYIPGTTGETLTVDDFDETKVNVGDTFQIGEVIVQANFPRIPCGKVSFRMQHEQGQKAMQDCGRSGVYLRVLQPGKISMGDSVVLKEKAKVTFSIFELYGLQVKKEKPSAEQLERAVANGAFPVKYLQRWLAD
ncbi:MAG: MOSC domain-containing protein [Bdellovibrionota bacterium]